MGLRRLSVMMKTIIDINQMKRDVQVVSETARFTVCFITMKIAQPNPKVKVVNINVEQHRFQYTLVGRALCRLDKCSIGAVNLYV